MHVEPRCFSTFQNISTTKQKLEILTIPRKYTKEIYKVLDMKIYVRRYNTLDNTKMSTSAGDCQLNWFFKNLEQFPLISLENGIIG